MRIGFTTGSCSAAAAKAAIYMLISGNIKEEISIITPKGIEYKAEIVDIERGENYVKCSVVKDGGDDPDITTGAHIYAKVTLTDDVMEGTGKKKAQVNITGGTGVGVVTKPGLDQPVGNAAINHVPREMIEKEVLEICDIWDYKGSVNVEIGVVEGEELAKKTFNPRLGIVGGISILGTSGVVEPMSNQAILDTIKVELNQKKALGHKIVAVSPGNYGLDFMKNTYGFDLDKSVKCSNFIGATIDMAVEAGFEKMLLTGHIGKLIKVSGGIMNTHSKEGDCRMELMAAAVIHTGSDGNVAKYILDSVTTEEGIRILGENGGYENAMNYIMKRIMFYLNKRGNDKIEIECIMYSNQFGLLAHSENAMEMMEEWRDKWSTL